MVLVGPQDELADGEDVLFYGDLEDDGAEVEETQQQQQRGRQGRSLGVLTAGASLGASAINAVGPSLTGAAAITSSIKPLVWGGLGACELSDITYSGGRKSGPQVW